MATGKGSRTPWTDAEIAYIEDHYPYNTTDVVVREMAALFGIERTPQAVYKCASYAGLKKAKTPPCALPTKARMHEAEDIIYRLVDRLVDTKLDDGGIALIKEANTFIHLYIGMPLTAEVCGWRSQSARANCYKANYEPRDQKHEHNTAANGGDFQ